MWKYLIKKEFKQFLRDPGLPRMVMTFPIIIIFVFAHIVIMASFGLLISNYSDNIRQAMFVIWFFSMIFMLMSGIFTPIASMPTWAKCITYVNPLRYFADAMRCIFLKGSTLADLWFDLVCLLGIGSVTTTWAILSYEEEY